MAALRGRRRSGLKLVPLLDELHVNGRAEILPAHRLHAPAISIGRFVAVPPQGDSSSVETSITWTRCGDALGRLLHLHQHPWLVPVRSETRCCSNHALLGGLLALFW